MKTALKVFAGVLGFLVVLIIGAVFVLPAVVNPNDFKPQLTKMLSKATGHQVSIPGNIKLSTFPWFGVTIGRVRVANAKGFGGGDLAGVHNASVHLKLLPLVVHRRIEVGKVDLNGLRLNLVRNRDGRTNWAGFTAHAGKAQGGQSHAPAGGHRGLRLPALQIAGVDVRNALITWTDERSNRRYQLSDLSLTTGRIAAGQPSKVDLGFNASATHPAMRAHVKLASTVTLAPRQQRLSISDLRLTVNAQGKGVPGGHQQLVLAGAGSANLKSERADLSRFSVKVAGMALSGAMTAARISAAPQIKGHLAVASFDPRQVMHDLGLKPPATADAKAFTQASLQSRFQVSRGDVQLSDLRADLDGSHLTGSVGVKGTRQPAVDFALAVDRFNLDRYRAARTAKPAAPKAAAPGGAKAGRVPVKVLRKLDVNGHLQVASLQAMGARMSDVKLAIDAHRGHIVIRPLSAKLYGGQLTSDGEIDAAASPTYRFNVALEQVQAGPLLHDVMGRSLLTGIAQFDMRVHTAGQTQAAMRKALNGNLRFAFRNGMIRGMNLAQLIRQGQAILHGQKPPAGQTAGTDFSSLTGTATIANGQMSNKDLRLLSPLLRVAGNGKVDLVRNRIDYALDARLVKSLQGQGASAANSAQGISVPLRVTGPLMTPHVGIDTTALIQQHLGNRRKALEQKLKSHEQQLQKKAIDQLRKLF